MKITPQLLDTARAMYETDMQASSFLAKTDFVADWQSLPPEKKKHYLVCAEFLISMMPKPH